MISPNRGTFLAESKWTILLPPGLVAGEECGTFPSRELGSIPRRAFKISLENTLILPLNPVLCCGVWLSSIGALLVDLSLGGEKQASAEYISIAYNKEEIWCCERKSRFAMEITSKDERGSAPVLDIDSKSTVGGGIEDVYGEDRANEDQPVTRWTISVARYTLLRDPHYNKGLAFKERERCSLLAWSVKKMMHNIRQYQVPLQKYMARMDLQERNERLFYKLLIDNVEELLLIVYTPTIGEACSKYGSIFRGNILEVLKNWPERSIQVIVISDGERILGLGDLGCQGMGIPVGKLALYTALGRVRHFACLPITIDVGTNNEKLLKDEFYIGEYADLLHEFMAAIKQNYGEKVLVQKYGSTHLVFNDDIQVYGGKHLVLTGHIAALKLLGGTLAEHTFFFFGAGKVGTGITEIIVHKMSKQVEVAKAVSRIIALALDLEVDFFDRQEMLGKPIAILRLLHYEGRVSDPMKGIYGAGAHSDFGLITLLATDDVYGLQICRDKDAKLQKWEFVAPLKGAFIVNLGDMLERWSNCIFRSTLHQVLGNGQERYSIAYFVEPSHDCVVDCLPACQSQENPPKGFLQSNVKLTCSSSTRILKLFSSHTKNDTPNLVVNIAGIFAS
ncbi:unnamed protein product [Camellia sinensis]